MLPTPMIMGVGRIDDIRKAVSSDLKQEGNALYLIGRTKNEMGGSLLYRLFGGRGGLVPGVDFEALATSMDRLLKAMDQSLVRSCHDCSDGGLAVTLAEMCIAGDMGACIDLGALDGVDETVALFSESNSRWVAEIPPGNERTFREIMGDLAHPIGRSGGKCLQIASVGLNMDVDELRKIWSEPLWKMMG